MSNKPCPFCGFHNLELQIGTKDREGWPVAIICDECGAVGPWVYFGLDSHDLMLEAAFKQWNKRVAEIS